ncbi:topoisomerase C-terminal repeat-containing protein [Myroides pelagicus]|uniref:DNA topoisomerase type IA DNA-binding domain-containing protein n=1 Tax=Myroides pelagicus TaxID=270914 RepID=A0A7K1GP69_9FLAO|nr:hypothetical protein [Myroides pelagicus]MTH30578.1 hypothetical protein [Myroides pelagicus]
MKLIVTQNKVAARQIAAALSNCSQKANFYQSNEYLVVWLEDGLLNGLHQKSSQWIVLIKAIQDNTLESDGVFKQLKQLIDKVNTIDILLSRLSEQLLVFWFLLQRINKTKVVFVKKVYLMNTSNILKIISKSKSSNSFHRLVDLLSYSFILSLDFKEALNQRVFFKTSQTQVEFDLLALALIGYLKRLKKSFKNQDKEKLYKLELVVMVNGREFLINSTNVFSDKQMAISLSDKIFFNGWVKIDKTTTTQKQIVFNKPIGYSDILLPVYSSYLLPLDQFYYELDALFDNGYISNSFNSFIDFTLKQKRLLSYRLKKVVKDSTFDTSLANLVHPESQSIANKMSYNITKIPFNVSFKKSLGFTTRQKIIYNQIVKGHIDRCSHKVLIRKTHLVLQGCNQEFYLEINQSVDSWLNPWVRVNQQGYFVNRDDQNFQNSTFIVKKSRVVRHKAQRLDLLQILKQLDQLVNQKINKQTNKSVVFLYQSLYKKICLTLQELLNTQNISFNSQGIVFSKQIKQILKMFKHTDFLNLSYVFDLIDLINENPDKNIDLKHIKSQIHRQYSCLNSSLEKAKINQIIKNHNCYKCNSESLIKSSKMLVCTNKYCLWKMPLNIHNIQLSLAQSLEIIKNGKSKSTYNFLMKNNKVYPAYLYLDYKAEIGFDFHLPYLESK